MNEISILYVSATCIPEQERDSEMEQILRVARDRNPVSGVTGAMLSTGTGFAQCLEGPRQAVEGLLKRIAGDPRHRDVTVLQQLDIDTRRFGDWSMAYAGPSLFVKRTLQLGLGDRGRSVAAEKLMRLLTEFARD